MPDVAASASRLHSTPPSRLTNRPTPGCEIADRFGLACPAVDGVRSAGIDGQRADVQGGLAVPKALPAHPTVERSPQATARSAEQQTVRIGWVPDDRGDPSAYTRRPGECPCLATWRRLQLARKASTLEHHRSRRCFTKRPCLALPEPLRAGLVGGKYRLRRPPRPRLARPGSQALLEACGLGGRCRGGHGSSPWAGRPKRA